MVSNQNFILPNWHSLTCNLTDYKKTHNQFQLSSQIDFNGGGIFNNIYLKDNKPSRFCSLYHSLPFYVCDSRIKCTNNKSRNCILYYPQNNLIITGINEYVKSIKIEENTNYNEFFTNKKDFASNLNNVHNLSNNFSLNCPFVHRISHIHSSYSNTSLKSNPIIELKDNIYDNDYQISTISKSNVQILNFSQNEEQILTPLVEINEDDVLGGQFAFYDRNEFLADEVLFSFTSLNEIVNYNFEMKKVLWSSKDNNIKIDAKNQCALFWSKFHRKIMFYGTNNRINLIDTRGKNTIQSLFTKGTNNLFNWELFFNVCQNHLNEYQFFVISNYRLFCGDVRFPRTNLIQFSHMLTPGVRLIDSIVYKDDDKEELLLIAANNNRCCMFNINYPQQNTPTSLQSPMHISQPKQLNGNNLNIHGLKLIPFRHNKGFSFVQMNDYGDLYLQDYFHDQDVEEKSWNYGVGSNHLTKEEIFKKYTFQVENYAEKLYEEIDINVDEKSGCLQCKNCKSLSNCCYCCDMKKTTDNEAQNDMKIFNIRRIEMSNFFNYEELINPKKITKSNELLNSLDNKSEMEFHGFDDLTLKLANHWKLK